VSAIDGIIEEGDEVAGEVAKNVLNSALISAGQAV
jgi:ferritin-like metal-binding protein YciE